MNRRTFLHRGAVLLGAAATGLRVPVAFGQTPQAPAPGQPFSPAWLKEEARRLAAAEYQQPPPLAVAELGKLDWDQYQQIRFRPEQSLWRDQELAFRLQFFHLGLGYREPVRLFEVIDGTVHPIQFTPAMFDYGDNTFAAPLPDTLGFAGFRVHYHTDFSRDMASFLGASYFRAVDWQMQYGLSARGLAIDTVFPGHEEFPRFTTFWIERPAPGQTELTFHALLDSPSATGAYRFVLRPGRTTETDVEMTVFARRKIRQIGLAPLTSMYRHGENDRRRGDDFRPEVHDSDGLAMVRGNGERIWRPLANPSQFRVSTYMDENPRAFGLLQRDREFRNYQDDGVYYDRRPNLWVQPLGDWGEGAVGLVEIPADEETFDNIVAFWTFTRGVERGEEIALAYRLHWSSDVPDTWSQIGRVTATRIGPGGIPGQPRNPNARKFVIDFAGGPLDLLPKDAAVEPVITVSHGGIEQPAAYLVEEISAWRAIFDLVWEKREPVELRCFLRLRNSALTETWSYLWTPSG